MKLMKIYFEAKCVEFDAKTVEIEFSAIENPRQTFSSLSSFGGNILFNVFVECYRALQQRDGRPYGRPAGHALTYIYT